MRMRVLRPIGRAVEPVRRRLLAAAPLLALPAMLPMTGCTAIPVSAMWRLRSFGVDDLVALDPVRCATPRRAIRACVSRRLTPASPPS